MKIKSLHQHKVKIPVPGRKDHIEFLPKETKEVPDEIGKKLLESKGFKKANISKEEFFNLKKDEQIQLLHDKKINIFSKDKEADLYKKYSEVD